MSKNAEIVAQLNKILELELSGVVRYLHYSFMIFGPNRIPITSWFRGHADDGVKHATIIGEKITAYEGHPTLNVRPVPEGKSHKVLEILKESLVFEEEAYQEYVKLLKMIQNTEHIALEECIRGLVKEEAEHIEEVQKMIREV